MADAGYDATPQTPDATMTSVEVIQMPEDVPPAPEAVVEVQATFGGVTTDDAHGADFQEAIRAAVAEALDVDESQVHAVASVQNVCLLRFFRSHHCPGQPRRAVAASPLSHLPSPPVAIVSQVIITDVDTDDEGDVVVTYVVTGMDPADVEEAAATLETREVADAIVEQMQDEVRIRRLRVVRWGAVWWLQAGLPILSATRGMSLTRAWFLFFCCDAACLPAASRVRATTTWSRGRSMPATPPWRSRKCP